MSLGDNVQNQYFFDFSVDFACINLGMFCFDWLCRVSGAARSDTARETTSFVHNVAFVVGDCSHVCLLRQGQKDIDAKCDSIQCYSTLYW